MKLPSSATALIDECIVREQADNVPAALHWAEETLEAARSAGQPEGTAAALVAVARLRFRLGQYEAARGLATEALSLAPNHSPVCADAWQVLANCAADTDTLAQAEAYYRLAADVAREAGYRRALMAALHGLAAGAYFPRGRFELALEAAAEAQRIATELGSTEYLVYPRIITAIIYQTIGRHREAQAVLDELAPLMVEGSILQGYHLHLSAVLALERGEAEAAATLLGRARSVAEACGEPWLNCAVRLALSRLHRLAGDGPQARAWADDALAFASRLGYRHEQGRALIERGRAAWLCGDEEGAEQDLRTAAELLQAVGADFDLARGRLLLAALLHARKSAAAADAWQAAARAIIEGGYAFLLEQERALAFPLLAAYQTNLDPALARWSALLLAQLRRVPPPPLRVVTLGRFVVWQGRRAVEKRLLRQRRAGELLALLLLAPGHRLTAEQVAEALFPEKEPGAAQVLFHHATSALRHALEPELPEKFPSRYLEVEEGQVALTLPAGSWIDCEAFEAHCREGHWEEALALYGGELLPECRYADWALLPRERLNLLYQRALLAAAEARLAAGRPAEALDACQRLLALEPWHEGAVLVGMRACVALDDIAAARRLYLKLEKTLREELDTLPQAELREYYRRLTPQAP